MKHGFFYGLMVLAMVLAGCSEVPLRSSYRPVLPVVPAGWQEILGEPHWRVEWVDADGVWQERDCPPGHEPPAVSPPDEWCTPVLAWPYWPERNLGAGLMRPSGALFPWDSGGGNLRLSWQGGIDALFWKEMSKAGKSSEAAGGRLPWHFDWPRFRELFANGDIPEEVRNDPWLADWQEIGRKTVLTGFDRRRIVPRNLTEVPVPGMEGIWAGSSPFSRPLTAAAETPLVLSAGNTAETWVSTGGVLKCSASGWVFIPRE